MRRGRGRLLILSAAFTFLFFGAGLSGASAWDGRGGFGGHFAGHRAGFGFHGGGFHHRAFFGPRHGFIGRGFGAHGRFFARPYPGRFRFVRVRVFDPFPHFVWRRVYFAPPAFVDPFCAPY